MSFLADLAEQLAKSATDTGFLDRVGKVFMDGAGKPGTFTQGRDFAKTPEGLAAQFDWGTPEAHGFNQTKFPNPTDNTQAGYALPVGRKQFWDDNGATPGFAPFDRAGGLPTGGNLYTFDTAALDAGSGQGSRAYPTMYGHILNDPDAVNIKEHLTGSNAYRNNYALSSAIMRNPDAGRRLLASPQQFLHLPVDVANFRTASPERQVGALQVEGALQTLQRMKSAANSAAVPDRLKQQLDSIPTMLSSSMSPGDYRLIGNTMDAVGSSGIKSTALRSTGPRTLRKLGIVSDVNAGYDVDPSAFRGLEFCSGGPVRGPVY